MSTCTFGHAGSLLAQLFAFAGVFSGRSSLLALDVDALVGAS